jgi:hypothetical protein
MERPPVTLLLAIDREYREKAEAGELRRIAPRKLNPEGKAWLPVLNTVKDGWKITALFSNTERAHELNKTHEWVVIYAEAGAGRQTCTVVTESHGLLKGLRVVRGREEECAALYGESSGKLHK